MARLAAAVAAAAGCARAPALREWSPDAATPGVRLTLSEVRRAREGEATRVSYRVEASGVPRGTALRLWERRREGAPAPVEGVYVNDTGRLVSAQTGVEADWEVTGMAPGEPDELAAVSEDRRVKAYVRFIPVPVESSSGGGCRIEAELASLRGDAWVIRGSGFEPQEELNAVLKSGDDEHLETFLAGPDGRFSRTTFPAVHFGRAEGSGQYTVVGKSCRVSVPLRWGAGALKAG